MVRDLGIEDLEPDDRFRVRDQHVTGMTHRLCVVRRSGVGSANQVGQAYVGQHTERLTIGHEVEVTAYHHHVVYLTRLFDE